MLTEDEIDLVLGKKNDPYQVFLGFVIGEIDMVCRFVQTLSGEKIYAVFDWNPCNKSPPHYMEPIRFEQNSTKTNPFYLNRISMSSRCSLAV